MTKAEIVTGIAKTTVIVKRHADKTARNINKNTTLIVPAHNIPAFKPAQTFMDEVSKI